MNIVYFGTYANSEGYPRNKVVSKALRDSGCNIIDCHVEAWGDSVSRVGAVSRFGVALKQGLKISRAWIKLVWKYLAQTPSHDLVLVGYPGHLDVFMAKVLAFFTKKPLVFDAFLSLYEAAVEDRQLVKPYSLKARVLKFIDRNSARVADAVLLDTQAHINYYVKNYKLPLKKFIRVFVGAEEKFFQPPVAAHKINAGQILFFGSFLPLHGIDVIIEAATLLKNDEKINFTFIGDGPQWDLCQKKIDENKARITLKKEWLSYKDLINYIVSSEICLGIFSNSPKASRVIPCKVFNIISMGKPLITANTSAARELLIHKENSWLVKPGDPNSLADAIKKLNADSILREKIAEGGRELFKNQLRNRTLGKKLLEEFSNRFPNQKAV